MAAGEQFCLRWNDFETNISRAFQDLREEKDFLDVTLACDGEKQIKVHKVILSACSPFFRSVLRKNPHDHPLLYLKGVKYNELQSILNFMYYGEVNVAHEDLNGFLSVAEDLKIKGLTQSDNNKKSEETKEVAERERPTPAQKQKHPVVAPDPGPPPKRPRPLVPVNPPVQRNLEVIDDEIEEIRPPIKTEPGPAFSSSIAVQEEHEADNSSADGYGGEGYDYVQYDEGNNEGFGNDSIVEHSAEGTGSIVDGNKVWTKPEDLIEFHRDPMSTKIWRCKFCGEYSHNRGNAMSHVEAKHLNVVYHCEHCKKEFRSRNSFKTHKSNYHSEMRLGDDSIVIPSSSSYKIEENMIAYENAN